MTHSRSASDQSSLAANQPLGANPIYEHQSSTFDHSAVSEDELLSGLVSLYLDIVSLSGEQTYILNEIVIPSLPSSIAGMYILHFLNTIVHL